jgi:hypothetical protein
VRGAVSRSANPISPAMAASASAPGNRSIVSGRSVAESTCMAPAPRGGEPRLLLPGYCRRARGPAKVLALCRAALDLVARLDALYASRAQNLRCFCPVPLMSCFIGRSKKIRVGPALVRSNSLHYAIDPPAVRSFAAVAIDCNRPKD